MGEVDFTGILVLELFQAAARAAVAQAFPFGAGHLFQRLGFPEESLLGRGSLGRCGHDFLNFSGRLLLGAPAAAAQVGLLRAQKEWRTALGLSLKSQADHWFMASAR